MPEEITSNVLYNVNIASEMKNVLKNTKIREHEREEINEDYRNIGQYLKQNNKFGVMGSAGLLMGSALRLGEFELAGEVYEFMTKYTEENILEIVKECEIENKQQNSKK